MTPQGHREGFGCKRERVSGLSTLRLPLYLPASPSIPQICLTALTVAECCNWNCIVPYEVGKLVAQGWIWLVHRERKRYLNQDSCNKGIITINFLNSPFYKTCSEWGKSWKWKAWSWRASLKLMNAESHRKSTGRYSHSLCVQSIWNRFCIPSFLLKVGFVVLCFVLFPVCRFWIETVG